MPMLCESGKKENDIPYGKKNREILPKDALPLSS